MGPVNWLAVVLAANLAVAVGIVWYGPLFRSGRPLLEGAGPDSDPAHPVRNYGSTVAVMLMAAPVIGLLFAVFLPFIGIAMTLSLIGRKLAGGVVSAAAGSMSFGWRPIEAYLAGKKRKNEARAKKDKKDAGK